MLGREEAVERTGVSHPNVVCLPAVSEGHSKNPGKCCSLWVEELVVSAGRGGCKAGKAGPESSQAACPAVVPGAVTAQPGHMFR